MVFYIICLQANVLSNEAETPPHYDGNRILLTAISILESNKDELKISMNAINTGRNVIEFGVFSNIPEDLELKFEESFYRSSLKDKEIEIKNLLFAKVLKLPAGKIIRNIELSLSSDEELYKSLGKKKQRYARHYQPKIDKTKPDLKYKTKEETPSALSSILKKKKKNEKVAVKTEVKLEEEISIDKETIKKQEALVKAEEKKLEMAEKEKAMAEAKRKKEAKKVKEEKLAAAKAKQAAIEKEQEQERERLAKLKNSKIKEDAENRKRLESYEIAKAKEEKEKKERALAEAKKKQEAKEKEAAKLAAAKAKQESEEKKKLEDQAKLKEKQIAKERQALAEAKKKEEDQKLAEVKRIEAQKKAADKRVAETKRKSSKKTIKETDEKFKRIEEKQKKKADDEAVLSALGLDKKETQTSKPTKKRSGSLLGGNEEEAEDGFDMSESIKASKNSYSEKEVCPDLYIDTIFVVKQNNRWLEIEYILNNSGKGPAHLLGKSSSDEDNLAVRAFLSSTNKLTRGSLPIGGGFIYNSPNDGLLEVNGTYRGKLKLDIKKLTRFTPYLILSVDPFNAITECDKTNNKHPSLINK